MALNPVKKSATVARSIVVMRRAGLITPGRPLEMLRSVRDLRHLGPAGGPFRIAGRRHPDRLGLVDELGEMTFGEVDRQSWALANAWRDQGASGDSTIAILCRDHRWLILSMSAASRIGATVVLMNTGFAPRQLADVAEREGVTDLVYDDEFAELAAAVAGSIRLHRAWTESDGTGVTIEQQIAAGSDTPFSPPRQASSLVMLTSGTTGTPKGAPRQVRSPFAPAQFVDRVPLRTAELTMLAAPAFHGTGLSQLLITTSLGSATAMRRRFDPEATLQIVDRHRATALVLVPTMLQRILDLPEEIHARYDTSSLRIILTAGAALPAELGNRATERFGDVIHNLYGSTECAVATVATPEDWRAAPGTVGKPPVGCEVRLYAAGGRRVSKPNEQGSVYIGNGIRFSGYTGGGSKDEIDGLLSSGDVGHFDEGRPAVHRRPGRRHDRLGW